MWCYITRESNKENIKFVGHKLFSVVMAIINSLIFIVWNVWFSYVNIECEYYMHEFVNRVTKKKTIQSGEMHL